MPPCPACGSTSHWQSLPNPPPGVRYWACQCGHGEAEEQTRGYGMRRSLGNYRTRTLGPWLTAAADGGPQGGSVGVEVIHQ